MKESGGGNGTTHTRACRLEAVKLGRERGVTVAQAARDLTVEATMVRRSVWECAADAQQASSARDKSAGDRTPPS